MLEMLKIQFSLFLNGILWGRLEKENLICERGDEAKIKRDREIIFFCFF
jgi:hypothetical protein